jgi:hypothetical protein
MVKLIQPGTVNDPLTEILRNGARALLIHAVEAEVADFLAKHGDLKTEDGRQRVVRHGHLPEREVMTGIGPVAVRQPRVRDRETGADDRRRLNQYLTFQNFPLPRLHLRWISYEPASSLISGYPAVAA